MKFLAPEYLPLIFGVLIIIAFYMLLRRRIVVRTGFYRLWLEAAQELGYTKRLRLRKLISILIASVIFGLLVFALMQPAPVRNSKDLLEKREKQVFVVVDTFFETFPYFDQCIRLQNIFRDFSVNKTQGKLYYQDVTGIHVRSFKEAEKLYWREHIIFKVPDIHQLFMQISKHAEQNDEILIITLNKTALMPGLEALDKSILQRVKFVKILDKTSEPQLKSDIAIIKISQTPQFPFEARTLTITLKNFSHNPELAELILYPFEKILQSLEFDAFEERNISISIKDIVSKFENSDAKKISFKDSVKNKNPLYFLNLTREYSIKQDFPVLLELRNLSNTYDLRPANNYAFLTIKPPKFPKVAVIGEDADNEYVRSLFSLFQESGMLRLVKLRESPEVVIQLGKTELQIPENVHHIKFTQSFAEYDAPSAYFWRETSLLDAEPLQKLFFSLKKVSYHIPGSGEVLLDSSRGILGRITREQEKITVHFGFSVNPENSDFLLRSEIAPALFSKLLHALTKDSLEFKVMPAYFTDEKIKFCVNQYLAKIEHKISEINKIASFKDVTKNTVHSLPRPGIPGISLLQTKANQYYIASNTIRPEINLDECADLIVLQVAKLKIQEEKNVENDEKTKILIILIQIAFLLVLTEAILYRLKITE